MRDLKFTLLLLLLLVVYTFWRVAHDQERRGGETTIRRTRRGGAIISHHNNSNDDDADRDAEELLKLFDMPTTFPNARLWDHSSDTIDPAVRARYFEFSPAAKRGIVSARKVYITYGDNCCAASKQRACAHALKDGKCDECRAFDRSVMDAEFQARHERILSTPRGAGLWLWKPYIINKTLNELRDGEYLIYADAGIYFVGPVHSALLHMETHDSVYHGVLISIGGHPMFRWCKRDAFVRQRCDTERCHNAPQVDGAFSFWRKGPHALRVANAWLSDALDYASISDAANTEGLPNLEGFVDHRHDQAVLTNVLVREHWPYQQDRAMAQLMAMFVHDRNKA